MDESNISYFNTCVSSHQDEDGADRPGWGGEDQEDWRGAGFLHLSRGEGGGWEDEAEGGGLPAVRRGS